MKYLCKPVTLQVAKHHLLTKFVALYRLHHRSVWRFGSARPFPTVYAKIQSILVSYILHIMQTIA